MDLQSLPVSVDRVLIAVGCGGATLALLKQYRIAAGILAGVLSWLFWDHAVYVAGAVLTLLVVTNLKRGRTEKAGLCRSPAGNGDIIDAEFRVVREEGRQ